MASIEMTDKSLPHLGFREVIPDQSSLIKWRTIVSSTGASQSTLQDIKVPEYGGSFIYKPTSPVTRNRHIAWRVYHDVVELWEESLDFDFTNNHIQIKFVDSPILEGLSVHETKHDIYILLATVSSVHKIRLTHPSVSKNSKEKLSIFSELNSHNLKEHHSSHVLNSTTTGEGLPHTASTHLVSSKDGNRIGVDAFFVLCQTGGTMLVVRMSMLPFTVHTNVLKNTSLINRFFTGFVPGMFRGIEGGETVTSVALHQIHDDVLAVAICKDGRIRVWSCTKMECVLAHDCLENTSEAGRKMTPAAQRHLVRLYADNESCYLGVFLSFAEKQIIVVYNPVWHMGQLSLRHIETLYPPQFDLVDMTVTSSYIWTLWTNDSNIMQLLYAPVITNGGHASQGMMVAILQEPPEKEIPLSDPTLDIREVYLKELFAPNRFSALTLKKALGIYRRNIEGHRVELFRDTGAGIESLKEDVLVTLREEVEARTTPEMSEDEIYEVTVMAWSTFYSHTLQYHQVGQKGISVVPLGGGETVGILKKQCLSWLRPVDALELLTLGSIDNIELDQIANSAQFREDSSNAAAVLALAHPLRAISKAVEPEVASAFHLDLLHGHSPDQVALGIAGSLLTGGEAGGMPLVRGLEQQLGAVPGIVKAIEAYLKALQFDLGNSEALGTEITLNFKPTCPEWIEGCFGGTLGSAIIAANVCQMSQHRLNLCRDLLLLQHVVMQLGQIGHLGHLSHVDAGRIRSTFIAQTTLLTQGYYALMKVATAPDSNPPQSTLESSRHQLAVLALGDVPLATLGSSTNASTVLETFIQTCGGHNARYLVSQTSSENSDWGDLIMSMSSIIAQFAWPISRCLLLVEALVWGGQHVAVQEYIRLLRPWCEWNGCSRKFLFAVSLLNYGESRKAAGLFLSAAEGVASEEFLMTRVAGADPETDAIEEAKIQYFLRVIRLLEQSGHIHLALEVAQAGVTHASPDDPGLAALYSVAFKHHLELGHHDEAFTALLACPDHYRRRNCLRQLVVTLYDRKCLSTLVNYQYGSLEGEVVMILENRARSADILVNNYYNLLFAFHVRKLNYKKAAGVMYECAMRLNVEGAGEAGLRQQAKCYLSCLNCLGHIPKDHAWILKPVPKSNDLDMSNEDSDPNKISPKRDIDGLSIPSKCRKAQVEVLEVSDIEREYQLIHARLKLFKAQSEVSQPPSGPMSPMDTISLLTHGKLYRDAVILARLFKLPVAPILQGLAAVCVQADQSKDKLVQWNWLSENGIQRDSGENCGWWSLLKVLLEEEEKGKQSFLHKAVSSTLLQHSYNLPAWLVASYKKRNTGELIQLYNNFGFIENSVQLTCEYLDAILGKGTNEFGLDNALHSSAPPVWVPYNAIDHLLLELSEVKLTPPFGQLHTKLKSKIQTYQQELIRVSQDRIILMQR